MRKCLVDEPLSSPPCAVLFRSASRFQALIEGKTLPFTLVVRDPLGNSFVGSSEHENPADDPRIKVREAALLRVGGCS